MKSLSLRFALLVVTLLGFGCLAATGNLDPSFDAGSGVDGRVRAMVVQPDGKIVIGGEFRTVKGRVRNKFARLNSDGSDDASFNAQIGGDQYSNVRSIALLSDSKILLGGEFASINGINQTNIA